MIADSGIPTQAVDEALERIMEIEEIVYAALWLERTSGDAAETMTCVGVRPAGTPVRDTLSLSDDQMQWVLQTPAFNWTVSVRSFGRRDDEKRQCAYVMFSLDREVLLEVCVLGSARRIARRIDLVHAALAGLSRSLASQDSGPAPVLVQAEGIDLEFVEAAAMGDRQFVRQILDIAADELNEGLSDLREAAGRADREAIRFQAHRIRSTARTLGASALDTRMEALETAGEGETTVRELLRTGIEEAEAVLRALERATRSE